LREDLDGMKKTRGIGKGNLCIPLQSYELVKDKRGFLNGVMQRIKTQRLNGQKCSSLKRVFPAKKSAINYPLDLSNSTKTETQTKGKMRSPSLFLKKLILFT